MSNAILEFQGSFRFLSNFWMCPVTYEGLEYPSSEHAYQAAKTLDIEQRALICGMTYPASAKRAGRTVVKRSDWEEIKVQVMHDIVLAKFTQNPLLREQLLFTEDSRLEEGNAWGDHFWGICPVGSGSGLNHLGEILMQVRQELLK